MLLYTSISFTNRAFSWMKGRRGSGLLVHELFDEGGGLTKTFEAAHLDLAAARQLALH
jgi:hypothetical protein